MKTPERIVLDTYAVLAFLSREPAAERVADILTAGEPWMTLVNLGEVTYVVERRQGKAAANKVFANLLAQERPERANQSTDGQQNPTMSSTYWDLLRRGAPSGLIRKTCDAGAAAL